MITIAGLVNVPSWKEVLARGMGLLPQYPATALGLLCAILPWFHLASGSQGRSRVYSLYIEYIVHSWKRSRGWGFIYLIIMYKITITYIVITHTGYAPYSMVALRSSFLLPVAPHPLLYK